MEYGIDDIDEHGAVKAGVGIWMSSLFLTRQFLYAPLMLLAKRKGRGGSGAEIDLSYVQIFSIWELVACIPALLVLVALLKRKPEAGSAIRWVCANAKSLLVASAAVQLAIMAYALVFQSIQNPFLFGNIIVALYVLIFIMRSRRLTDVMQRFPGDR